ncbi:cysteine--tRNA ligase, cytoplasmic isoform X3 [Homalodisca vitripennis]|uniref:cysteine--tRNA ligase, cytoplasmic isoform X3 n=1 Tax=Homalodisca vitripennis TaxID=197043 RepID=UPI001EEAFB2C|nr:cysteine--tRNA ligase, cytoplasmic isoform X3 [Homalodisca vitripennis]
MPFNSNCERKKFFKTRKVARLKYRSYITFDILRRVLSDYFGYNVVYVMNITDIDDKIIKRARQQHLYAQYISTTRELALTLSDTRSAMDLLVENAKKATDPDQRDMLMKLSLRVTAALENLEKAVKSNDEKKIDDAKTVLIDVSRDPLSDWLDKEQGHLVTDNDIFTSLPRHWEAEYHRDMDALNVLRPNVLTRVSEYVPEIVAYIEKIIANGLAYESNGSVYFDVKTFDARSNHYYAKLVPEAYGDQATLQTGEGDLGAGDGEKKSPTDFALWKKSKRGEPWWESPWGKGRPGWHIECSAMASAICGQSLDIHTGGVDLKFPHHDNELAQAEAYFDNDQWVRYFLHSGHLTIQGCKMSKSLKNFVSIADALKRHTSRQLRLAFLLHSWKDNLDYSDNTMEQAINYEKMLNEFFLSVKDVTRHVTGETRLDSFHKWGTREMELQAKFSQTKEAVHITLCDNIETRPALDSIRDCITACNVYLRGGDPDCLLLRDIAAYITRIMRVFGAIHTSEDIGFPISSASAGNANVEELVMPYLTIMADFRDSVRGLARSLKATDILAECDKLRDDVLPNMGVRLEDHEGRATAVKLVDKDTLLREREAKKKAEAEKILEKERKRKEMEAAQALREAQKRVPPQEMFKSETEKYSLFDDKGIPTHDREGKELSKGQIKKLQKLWQAQEKKFLEFQSACNNHVAT